MINLNVKDAEYILTIIKEGNLSTAAQKLCISQPSLTQLIQRLNGQTGSNLFYRNGHNFVPTKEGELLAEACQKICLLSRDLEKQLDNISKKRKGTVIVGAPFNIGAYLFPRLFKIYQEKKASVKFQPYEARSPQLEESLLKNEIDLAVMSKKQKVLNPQLERILLMQERLVLSVPQGHPLNRAAKRICGKRHPLIDIKLTDGADYILSAPGQRLYDVCNEIFKKANITPHPVLVSRSFKVKKRMSAAGLGVTIFPEHYVEFYQSKLDANYYYLLPPYNFLWDISLYYRKDDLQLSAIAECIHILKRLFQEEPIAVPPEEEDLTLL